MSTGTRDLPRLHYLGIFVVSFVVICYQILLTRLFSVMLYYHFAFAGISLVMLGMTIGALRVYLSPERYSAVRLEAEWAKAALYLAISSIAVVLWFMYLPLVLPPAMAFPAVIGSMILFVVPFTFSGICVTLILTRSAFPVGRLYAADLVGAAAGCIVAVAALFALDPISLFVAIAAIMAISARLFVTAGSPMRRAANVASAALCIAFAVQAGLYLSGNDHLRLLWAKGKAQDNIVFERWNAISRVRVVPNNLRPGQGEDHPFGWGFGHEQMQTLQQYYLDIDADAATVISRFDGTDLKPFAFLANDVINMGYHVRPVQEAIVVGVGGGRDLMSALYFGVKHVSGVEINPAIFEALTQRFADFTGHLTERADVTLVNAEARSWINQSHKEVDLIQISLIDTWAATAAGGLTLSENKLYTVEAWSEFLARLRPNGVLAVSRWFIPDTHKIELYRLLSLAADVLRARGVAQQEIRSHLIAVGVNHIVTLLVSPDAFTPAELAKAHTVAEREGFAIVIDATTSWDATSEAIASGRADSSFYDALPIDVTAPTDNRPFFFFFLKPLRFLDRSGGSTLAFDLYFNDSIKVVGWLLLSTLACAVIYILAPLMRASKTINVAPMMPHLIYFAGIGAAFMFIEISQMQRLMVFLGHPVFGLTVVLFSLLLFGGIGSFTVASHMGARRMWFRPALLCVVLCLTGLATPIVTDLLKPSGVPVRIAASVALLAPSALLMGTMFAAGMAMSRRFAAQQAWFWGVNGATSVFASILGVVISMQFGIAQAFWTGVAVYALCWLLTVRVAAAEAGFAPVQPAAGQIASNP